VSKEIYDLVARLRGTMTALEGEAVKAEATAAASAAQAVATPPPPPPPSAEELQKMNQMVEEAEGLFKDLKGRLQPPPHPPQAEAIHQQAAQGKK
jgi:hypothetical protein